MKIKRWIAAILAGCLFLSAAACSKAEENQSDVEYIKNKGTLVVGITDFAPMDYKDENGEWIGFDADMARKVGESLGVEVQFTVIEWGNKLMELENKSIDCAWNGMTITEEILEGASSTKPYAKNAQVVVTKKENAEKYSTIESLKDVLIAVEDGSAGQKAAKAEGLNTNDVLDQAAALMEVSAGTSGACVVDLLMAGAMIGEGTSYPDLVITIRMEEEDYGVGCRKDSDLAEFINQQFVKLYQDGTMMELAEKYGIESNIVEQK